MVLEVGLDPHSIKTRRSTGLDCATNNAKTISFPKLCEIMGVEDPNTSDN